MRVGEKITILGGGPAGLAVAYHAQKAGFPFTLYEAADRIGGNCITLEHKGFLFDSGAHRFHNRDACATKDIKKLMGKELKEINIPSQIYHRGNFVDFPLSPLNLLKNLGPLTFSKAAFEVIGSRLRSPLSTSSKQSGNYKNNEDGRRNHFSNKSAQGGEEKGAPANFERFALQTYGPTLARRFLLNYSEKLWGMPCSDLSTAIAGNRMKGLNLKTFIKEAFLGRKAKTEHLDGSFFYPDRGIGTICDKLAQFCGPQNLRLQAKITRIFHDGRKVQELEINGSEKIKAGCIVSSLPIDFLLQIMKPALPEEILHLSKSLRYRSIILAVFFLNKELVTRAATVYFPDEDFIFTRLYEPKNRSNIMTPPGKTCLVLEIPCQKEDRIWSLDDSKLTRQVLLQLLRINLIKEDDIIDSLVFRMNNAYPVLAAGYKDKIETIFKCLGRFKNLKLTGRNGKFVYAHLHDMMKFGREIINNDFR